MMKEPDPIEHGAGKDLIFSKGILHPICFAETARFSKQ